MTDEKEIVPVDKKIIRIAKNLGRALRWVMRAASSDDARPVLTYLRIESRESTFGDGVVAAADGFRLHIARGINIGGHDPDKPWVFEKTLDMPEGTYDVMAGIQARDHINELWKVGDSFPDYQHIVPHRNSNLKPVAIVPINPQFLIDAVSDAPKGQPVFLRIFQTKSAIEEDEITKIGSIEIVSKDRQFKDVDRLAVVMPMHMRRYDVENDPFPITWDGWPKDKEEDNNDD